MLVGDHSVLVLIQPPRWSSCVTMGTSSSIVALIYRPGSQAVTTSFFDDLSDIVDCVTSYSDPTYIVGDLNVRLERDDDPNSQRLTELLVAYGYAVRVNEPKHVCGGLLDVVATRCDLTVPLVCDHDVGLSDHQLLTWSVATHRPATPVVSVVRRPWHKLGAQALRDALLASRLCQPASWTDCTVSHLADLYNNEITLIRAKTVTTRRRSSDPGTKTVVNRNVMSPLPVYQRASPSGTRSDASIVRYFVVSVNSSGEIRLTLRSRRHVSCGVLLTRCWAVDALGLSVTSMLASFIFTSRTKSLVSDLRQLTRHHRRIGLVSDMCIFTVSAGEPRGSDGCNSCTA